VAQTEKIAQTYGVVKKTPSASATDYTWAQKAVNELKAAGVDVYGKDWKKAVVHVTPGGK
jgi:hypothetical protein